jgi:hypothetical protein
MSAYRDAMNRWCARHPFGAGMTAGIVAALFTVEMAGSFNTGALACSFVLFSALFTLTALGERRRRKKLGLPLW